MPDARHAELALIAVAAAIACLLMMDAVRHTIRRGALEWRRGRLLDRSTFPGSFRLGVLAMRGAGLGFLFGAMRAAAELLDAIF